MHLVNPGLAIGALVVITASAAPAPAPGIGELIAAANLGHGAVLTVTSTPPGGVVTATQVVTTMLPYVGLPPITQIVTSFIPAPTPPPPPPPPPSSTPPPKHQTSVVPY